MSPSSSAAAYEQNLRQANAPTQNYTHAELLQMGIGQGLSEEHWADMKRQAAKPLSGITGKPSPKPPVKTKRTR